MNQIRKLPHQKRTCQCLIRTILKSRCLGPLRSHSQRILKKFRTSRTKLKLDLPDNLLSTNHYTPLRRSRQEDRPKLHMIRTLEMDFHIPLSKMTTYRHWNSHRMREMVRLVEVISQKSPHSRQNPETLRSLLRHRMMSSI
jgi:hypothetical protein